MPTHLVGCVCLCFVIFVLFVWFVQDTIYFSNRRRSSLPDIDPIEKSAYRLPSGIKDAVVFVCIIVFFVALINRTPFDRAISILLLGLRFDDFVAEIRLTFRKTEPVRWTVASVDDNPTS